MNTWHDDKRKKPWLSTLKLIGLAVLLLLALLVWYLLTIINAEAKVSVDYGKKVHESVRARQGMPTSADDHWALIIALAEKYHAARERVEARHPDLPPEAFDPTFLANPHVAFKYEDFTREQAEAVCRELIEEFRAAGGFDDLSQIAAIPYASRPAHTGALIGLMMPELGSCRAITRLNCARMRLAAEAGDDAELLASVEQCMALGKHISGQAMIIDYLVGVAMQAHTQQEVRFLIVEGRIGPSLAEQVLKAIDRHPLRPLGPVFDTERFMVLDVIQRTFSDTGRGNGRFLPTAAAELGASGLGMPGVGLSKPWRASNLAGLLHPDRRTTEARANEIYDGFIQAAAMSRTQRASAQTVDVDTLVSGNRMLEILIPSGYGTMRSQDTLAADREATRIMLALEIHRSRHGVFPPSLGPLAELLDDKVPLDPIVSAPFGYKVLESPDQHGRSYILYSITSDGVDNGGDMGDRPPEIPILPRNGVTNIDFVYNQPRLPAAELTPRRRTRAAQEAEGQQAEIAPTPAPSSDE
jgi:hypothetical protein